MGALLINRVYGQHTLMITVLFILFFAFVKIGYPKGNKLAKSVTVIKLDSVSGTHVTTRTNIRRVWKYNKTWFVFYSTDEAGKKSNKHVYKTAKDGINWSKRKYSPGFALPYFVEGHGYAHLSEGGPTRNDNRIWNFKHWILEAKINGEEIAWSEKLKIFDDPPYHTNFYYIQPRVDSSGNIGMTMRHVDHNKRRASKISYRSILWISNNMPWSLKKWNEPIEVISGINEYEVPDSHSVIPLNYGQWMVLARTGAGHYKENGTKGAYYARFFDGENWKKQYKLDTSDGTGGSDRRFSATFDKEFMTVHLVYTDGDRRLVYRSCKSPYRQVDWSEPSYPVKGICFTQSIGIDYSLKPGCPIVVYGIQKNSDKGRLHAGELYLIQYNGEKWSNPILISEKGRKDAWYPNMIENCSGDIGVLYLRNFYRGKPPKFRKNPWDVMFSKIERVPF